MNPVPEEGPAGMKIVVLDGFTLNPGDLSWEPLYRLGSCVLHDRSGPDEVVARSADAEVILTNKTIISANHIERLPRLRYIGVLATGYNVVDISAAARRGIPVTNVPDYGSRSVAQMTWALILELARHAGHHSATVKQGRWVACPDFCYWDYPLIELDGLTLGIVGLGRIGREVASLGRAFGMRLLIHTPHPPASIAQDEEFVDLDGLFGRADVITLHCPLTPDTHRLVNADRLARCRKSAFLVNTSRGGLIDQAALAGALDSGRLAGAAVDVLSVEPPPADNPLLGSPRCLITPHIAWATRAARGRLLATASQNLASFLHGTPVNVVNSPCK